MTIDQLKEAARKATPGPWDSFEGGNFTQVWVKGSKFGLPSHNMIADVNYRQNDKGENTPTQSRNNAAYIAAASPDVILDLIQKYEEATKWVSVEQAMPPMLKDVIASSAYGNIITGASLVDGMWFTRDGSVWDEIYVLPVAFWRIPAPPNESPEEKTDGRT